MSSFALTTYANSVKSIMKMTVIDSYKMTYITSANTFFLIHIG